MESSNIKMLDNILHQRRDYIQKRKTEEENETKMLEDAVQSLKDREVKMEKEFQERVQKLEEVYQNKMKSLDEDFNERVEDFEKEKRKMAEFNKIQNEIVILNVGGIKFTTSLKTLQAEPESMLGVMFSGRHPLVKQEDGSIFIDRDGTHFRIILNYLRGNISSIQQLPEDNFILSDLLSEVQYYQLVGFLKILEPTEEEQTVSNQSEILKPTEEEQTVISQFDLDEEFEDFDGSRRVSTGNLLFRNCSLNNLNFENIIFQGSVDFSDCSLVNTRFFNCFFTDGYHYSFDRADLNNCWFEFSYDYGYCDIISMIENEVITFYDAKNFELAVFDEEVKSIIKETYNL